MGNKVSGRSDENDQSNIGGGAVDVNVDSPVVVSPVSDAVDRFGVAVFPYHERVSGLCYSWGWGAHGQLGHGSDSSEHTPKIVEGLGRKCGVVQVTCGHFHTLVTTERGELYSFGRGDINGGVDRDLRPRLLVSLRGVNVVSSAGGRAHSLALADSGCVYAWGDSKFGQVRFVFGTLLIFQFLRSNTYFCVCMVS